MVEAMLQAGEEIVRGCSPGESSRDGEPASEHALIASTPHAILEMCVETATLASGKRTVKIFGESLDKLFANHHCTIIEDNRPACVPGLSTLNCAPGFLPGPAVRAGLWTQSSIGAMMRANRFRARLRRDLTVPSVTPVISEISS